MSDHAPWIILRTLVSTCRASCAGDGAGTGEAVGNDRFSGSPKNDELLPSDGGSSLANCMLTNNRSEPPGASKLLGRSSSSFLATHSVSLSPSKVYIPFSTESI